MMRVRLAVRDGGHVTDVIIPPFRSLPEVIVWGERFFSLHRTLAIPEESCAAEYREVFAYWVPPGQEPAKA
jgi:hypothetical protein